MADRQARKRAVNLSVDGELLDEARRLGVNVSETLEGSLRTVVKAEQEKRWLEENRTAISSINNFMKSTAYWPRRFDTGRSDRWRGNSTSCPIRNQRTHAIVRICSYSSPISFQDSPPRSLRRSSRATACRVQVASTHYCRLKAGIIGLQHTSYLRWIARLLRTPVANVEPNRQVIIAALDLLFTGF